MDFSLYHNHDLSSLLERYFSSLIDTPFSLLVEAMGPDLAIHFAAFSTFSFEARKGGISSLLTSIAISW